MAVESFIPISDAKQTVEKPVQQKPKIEELTKIEIPGKPVPASTFENKEDKKEKKRKSLKKKKISYSPGIKIFLPSKEYTLIITEKPQAALKIATALGKYNKINEAGSSYFEVEHENKKILVASAAGHLFNLTYKKGQKEWPIFETEWKPSFTIKKSSFTKKYYDLLKKLSKKAKEIIIATDFDIEGTVIGWNILRFICEQKNAKRMKFSTLTKEELKKAFDSPLIEMDWENAYAGEARHIIDWLYGINLSRALMSAIKKMGAFKVLSIGRVQGPALKIIVDREREIQNFKPVPFWQVFANVKNVNADFKYSKDIFNKEELNKFKDIEEVTATTKSSESKIPPGSPFDLTTLQREAYRVYKISPSQTLATAQKLYLDGLISYPRTSSQKIPDVIQPKKILKALEKHFPEAKSANRLKPIEGEKTDPAHPSIYPTGEYKKLTGIEEKIYNLIAKRFIAVFSQDAKTHNKKIVLSSLKNPEIKFSASGVQIIEKGWTSFYPIKIEENLLPDLEGNVKIEKIKIEEKKTQPPPRYTPSSLITLLEKKNLGTKATRSIIVDILYERGYLDGKSIQATPLGIKLINTLEKYSPIIIDENLTRQLEEQMEKIQNSKKDFEKKEEEVVEKAKRLILDISKEFKANEEKIGKELNEAIKEIREENYNNNILMLCPSCKKGNLRIMYNKKAKRYFVACSAYPECKQTYSLPPNALIKKAEENKKCEKDNFPKLVAIRKGKRPWEFCFNPNCSAQKNLSS